MSGALTTVIEGTLDTLADVAEHSGGLVGTAQAQSLAGEIKAFGLIVPSMAGAASEYPYLALVGIGLGVIGVCEAAREAAGSL